MCEPSAEWGGYNVLLVSCHSMREKVKWEIKIDQGPEVDRLKSQASLLA